MRAVPRVIETLRYPAATGDLPDAEILAVAVAAAAAGAGIGRTLVHAATAEFARRGVDTAKVVTTADNAAALAMYRACGFATRGRRRGARRPHVGGAGVDGLVALVAGLVGGFVLTPLARTVALRTGIVDRPGDLKTQRVPVAYLGGVAVFLAALAGPLLAGQPLVLVPAAMALALGLADDLRPLPVSLRIVVELAIAVTGALVVPGPGSSASRPRCSCSGC